MLVDAAYHMASSGDGALDRWGEDVAREEDEPVARAVGSLCPAIASAVEHRGELGHVDGVRGGRGELERLDAVDIVEMEDREGGHGGEECRNGVAGICTRRGPPWPRMARY